MGGSPGRSNRPAPLPPPPRQATVQCTFFVSALGRVPKWGSAARSTGLLMSEGTDSVLRILATEEGRPSAGNRLSQRETRPKGRRRRRGGRGTHLEGRISDRRGLPLCTCYDTSTWRRRQGQCGDGHAASLGMAGGAEALPGSPVHLTLDAPISTNFSTDMSPEM